MEEEKLTKEERRYYHRVKIRMIIGAICVLGFFVVLSFLLWYPIPADNKDAVQILLGFLGGVFATIAAYYFGDSEGHKGEGD